MGHHLSVGAGLADVAYTVEDLRQRLLALAGTFFQQCAIERDEGTFHVADTSRVGVARTHVRILLFHQPQVLTALIMRGFAV